MSLKSQTDDAGEDSDRRGRSARNASSRVRGGKRDSALKDQQSTGRKRAAKLYPLFREAACEWQGKTNCGGARGITGCASGLQQARHHGPDKNVTNNEEGNVHRICHYCHNRWHAKNDKHYDWNSTEVQPHNPRPMTEDERRNAIIDHMRFMGSKQRKVID